MSNDARRSRKAVVLWLALLIALGLADYFANIAKGATSWEALRHVLAMLLRGSGQAVVIIGIVLALVVPWLAHRLFRCTRCGAPRGPDDLFCDCCDPLWKPGLAAVATTLGFLGLVLLLDRVGLLR